MAAILIVGCSCLNAVLSGLEPSIMIGVAGSFSIKTNDFDFDSYTAPFFLIFPGPKQSLSLTPLPVKDLTRGIITYISK